MSTVRGKNIEVLKAYLDTERARTKMLRKAVDSANKKRRELAREMLEERARREQAEGQLNRLQGERDEAESRAAPAGYFAEERRAVAEVKRLTAENTRLQAEAASFQREAAALHKMCVAENTRQAARLAAVESIVARWAKVNERPPKHTGGDFNDGFEQGQRSAYDFVVGTLRGMLAPASDKSPLCKLDGPRCPFDASKPGCDRGVCPVPPPCEEKPLRSGALELPE